MTTVRVEFPTKLRFLFAPARYKVAYGGRGGAKSWSFARALLIKAATKPLRILCARELQLSISDSVHKLLEDQIDRLGYKDIFDVQRSTIRCVNGSEFIFSGLRQNVSKVRSMEGIDIVWVEEAEAVSEDSWSVLTPTIRKDGSEIWVTFNPREKEDPTYKRFVTASPPGAVVKEINWMDNPWFPETLQKEKDFLYSVDKDAADHVWGGKTRAKSKAQVLYGKTVVEPFEPKDSWHGPYYGADWGFANEPTALVKLWVVGDLRSLEKELYFEDEAYGVGVDIDETPELFASVTGSKKHVIRADSARPETISHMQQHGYPKMIAAKKGAGSVEDGVAHLRGYKKIVIHPRCIHSAEEARLWSWKVDKLTGDVLPILVDKFNHCMDGARYALEPIMKKKKPKLVMR